MKPNESPIDLSWALPHRINYSILNRAWIRERIKDIRARQKSDDFLQKLIVEKDKSELSHYLRFRHDYEISRMVNLRVFIRS